MIEPVISVLGQSTMPTFGVEYHDLHEVDSLILGCAQSTLVAKTWGQAFAKAQSVLSDFKSQTFLPGLSVSKTSEMDATYCAPVSTPAYAYEASVLVIHAIGQGRMSQAELTLNRERPFLRDQSSFLNVLLAKRCQGVPLQHIVGFESFWGRDYQVSSDVLIPRQETEMLLMHCVRALNARTEAPGRGFELGLGSGVLSIELLTQWTGLRMVGTEPSVAARQTVRANAEQHLPDQCARLQIEEVGPTDILEPIVAKLGRHWADFLISNPPYLDEKAAQFELEPEVLIHEPHQALFPPTVNGINDPLFFYRGLAVQAPQILVPGGSVFLEIPHERVEQIGDLFLKQGCWSVSVHSDLTHRPRVLVAILN